MKIGLKEWIAIVSLIVALFVLLFGNNIYQQLSGHSLFAAPTLESTSGLPSRAITIERTNLDISADRSWQDTGIKLNPGDKLAVQYLSGQWDWTKDYPDFDAAGDPDPQNTCRSISLSGGICPIPEARVGALVAKIGNTDPFLVGNYVECSLPENTGREQLLYLMINDVFGGLSDNNGAVEVSVSVTGQ